MNTIRVNRKSLGINFSARGEAEILVWAPQAEHLALFIPNSNEHIDLLKQEDGYWSCITPRIKPGDLYFFRLDNQKLYPDPATMSQPEGITGPSQVINVHQFEWTDIPWRNIPLVDYIFYELHTGTFTAGGSFSSMEEKLDYLKDLGITAIEIMPVAQFSGTRNWGYDGVFPFAVQHSYGGAVGLQHLVNACHQRGLAVVLDVVYNHLGPEGNILNKFGPYFTDKYHTPWGDAINVDDAGCDAVRKYIIENVLMWFRDFHIDALRLDAVHAISDFSPKHILKEIKEYVNELMTTTGRSHYLIVECDLNDVRYVNDLENQGYGMDAQWVDEFHHALRVTTGNERQGYYEDFDGLLHLAKSYHDAYVYDGIYSPHRDKVFGTKTTGLPGSKFVVFSQNHDHVGNRMRGERTGTLVSFEMQKVMAAAVLMSPFLPLLFMGEEYGEVNPFMYFVSHSDRKLIEEVRAGRKREFAAFHTEGEVPDPQSETTFQNSKLNWNLSTKNGRHRVLLSYYKKLIALRKGVPALSNPDRMQTRVQAFERESVLMLTRTHEHQAVLCVFNFSNQVQHIPFPEREATWRKLLDSSDALWEGPVASRQAGEKNGMLLVHPESFLLLHDV